MTPPTSCAPATTLNALTRSRVEPVLGRFQTLGAIVLIAGLATGCSDWAERRRAAATLEQFHRALREPGAPLHNKTPVEFFAARAAVRPNAAATLARMPDVFDGTLDGERDGDWSTWAMTDNAQPPEEVGVERWLAATSELAVIAASAAEAGYTALTPTLRKREDLEQPTTTTAAYRALRNRVLTLPRVDKADQAFAEMLALIRLEYGYRPWSLVDHLLHGYRIRVAWHTAAVNADRGVWSPAQLQELAALPKHESVLAQTCVAELVWEVAVDDIDANEDPLESVTAAAKSWPELWSTCQALQTGQAVDWEYAQTEAKQAAEIQKHRDRLSAIAAP